MASANNYEPTFKQVPDTWDGRWELVREFVRKWHGLPLGPVGRRCALQNIEAGKLGLQLPHSFLEWIAFAEELKSQNAFGILRDCYLVERLQEHPAVSLMILGEGNVEWAVAEDDLGLDDPPVQLYYESFEDTGDKFLFGGAAASSISSFVVGHLAHYLRGRGGGCVLGVNPTEEFLNSMRDAFPVTSKFGNLSIFERQNIVAFVVPPQFGIDEHSLLVDVWKPISFDEIPECIRQRIQNGGAFRGMFVDQLKRSRSGDRSE